MTAMPFHRRLADILLRLLTELAAVAVMIVFLLAVLLESVYHRPWVILVFVGLAWFIFG